MIKELKRWWRRRNAWKKGSCNYTIVPHRGLSEKCTVVGDEDVLFVYLGYRSEDNEKNGPETYSIWNNTVYETEELAEKAIKRHINRMRFNRLNHLWLYAVSAHRQSRVVPPYKFIK